MDIHDSERLTFDFITEKDELFVYDLDQNPEVMKFINGGRPTSKQDIKEVFLPRLAAYANKDLGWGLWKVMLKADKAQAMGWVLVRPMGFFSSSPDVTNMELGWRFKQEYWGKGYASEAAVQVREALINSGIRRFSALVDPDNLASVAVMKKLGMAYSHTERYTDALFDEDVAIYTQTIC